MIRNPMSPMLLGLPNCEKMKNPRNYMAESLRKGRIESNILVRDFIELRHRVYIIRTQAVIVPRKSLILNTKETILM